MNPASTQPASESALASPHREIVKRAGLFAADLLAVDGLHGKAWLIYISEAKVMKA